MKFSQIDYNLNKIMLNCDCSSKLPNMFPNIFKLCDDVIRLPWQSLFIEHDFLTSIMGGYFHTSQNKGGI